MSVRKIKIVVKDDIRIAKIDKSLNYDEQLKSIINIVETKFNLSSNNYVLRYKDDEGDLITLSDSSDLEEAYDTTTLPKIYVELKNKAKEGKTEKNSNNTNEKEEKTSEEEEKTCICGVKLRLMKAHQLYSGRLVQCDGCDITLRNNMDVYHCMKEKSSVHPGGYDLCAVCYKGEKRVTFDQFIRDVQKNNKLKREFQNFLVEFLSFVKKSNNNIKDSLKQIIKKYKELNNNDYVKKIMKEQLDVLVKKYEDLVKFIAKNINPKDALIYFDMALTSCNNIKTFVLGIPPFKFLFDGLDKGNVNFNWGQTDTGNNNNNNNNNNKPKESKEEKQQRKINEKKSKLENKKQKLLEKLKQLEEEENKLSKSQEKPKQKIEEQPKVEENNNNNNNNVPEEEEEVSEEFQILESSNQNEIDIIEEPQEQEQQEEDNSVVELFAYEEALQQIKNMGFSDEEAIKFLLMKHNGNTAQTVNDLLA